MKAQRKLPEIVIDGISMIVDVAFAELRHKEYPDCRVSFHNMDREGGGYALHVEPMLQGLSETPHPLYEKHIIGQMVVLDPEGICIKYGLERQSLPTDDSGLSCDPKLIEKRLKGVLPQIDIAGKEYHVDVRLGELHSVDDQTKRIILKMLSINGNGNYVFLYDHKKHHIVNLDIDKITKEPPNTVMIELPHELWLDPIGVARKQNIDELSLLGKYPLQHELKARIYPLAETFVANHIHKNIERKRGDYVDDLPFTIKPQRKKGRHL
ncbi:hypothetical protein [Pedobacter chitinilyticus]|uniref:Uncharacterized protein n=1 Tax=Pedobacter chitinilyticus TaxID=2233776 RepID=A0A3S3R6S1_9SPHI|nr:hypothetical protein [Pedobacter chitinilyticus]RWU08136.1 hypothetical protein DPV69_07080 [Pedobacter chitinilyticus]